MSFSTPSLPTLMSFVAKDWQEGNETTFPEHLLWCLDSPIGTFQQF